MLGQVIDVDYFARTIYLYQQNKTAKLIAIPSSDFARDLLSGFRVFFKYKERLIKRKFLLKQIIKPLPEMALINHLGTDGFLTRLFFHY